MDTQHSSNADNNFEAWFEQMPFGLYRTGVDGTILYANQAVADLFGFENPAELMQYTVYDLYHSSADRNALVDELRQSTDDVNTQDILMRRKDGTPIWVRNTIRIIRDDEGQVRYFQGGLQNINREKEKEQQLALHSLNLRTLNVAISAVADDPTHLDEMLTNALAYLKDLIPYTTASIFLFEGDTITHTVGLGFPSQGDFQEVCRREDLRKALLTKRDEMIAAHRGWLIVDIQEYDNWVDTPIDQNIRSHLAVALLHHDKVIGILNLDQQKKGFFTPDLAELAMVVGQQLSLMIVNARLYMQATQEVQRREEAQVTLMQNLLVSQTLYQVLNHLFEAKNVQIALPQVLPIIAMSLDVENIVSLVFDPSTEELLYMADVKQDDEFPWQVYQQVVGERARDGKMSDVDLYWPRGRAIQLEDGRHVLATVVFHRGILAAVRSADAEPFHETEHELLVTIANQLTIAVDNEQLYSQLRSKNVNLEHLISQRTEQLQLEQKRLQAILDATAEGIFYMEDFRIHYANPAFCKMVGYSAEELRGKPLSFVRPQDESVTKTLNFSQLFGDSGDIEEAIRSETALVHRSGSIIYASIRYSLIGAPGDKQMRMVAVARDISRERDLYYQQARFISNAAHELRNPLSSLGLRLHLLRRQPQRLDTHLENLEQVTKYLQDLVEELVDLARFQRGTIELERSEQVLQAIIEEAITTNQPFAEKEGVTLIAELPPKPIKMFVDRTRLLQLVSTLIVNGINYNYDGGEVRVALKQQEDELGNSRIILEVSDTGEGIDTHLLPAQIFEPFVRPSQGTRRETGMGLALARRITQLHGGRIDADNESDAGSVFRVTLHQD